MNFRELINQLHTIDQPILSETVTLDSIMAAVGNETDEQKRADLLQKMAEKENLPGLYDPISGYFVSVFQDREPMTNQLKTRISSTASSAVTNQLADLGLVPGKANTRSLGGLVGVGALSNSTEKNDEMDQEVKNRFKNKQPVAQSPNISATDEGAKMTQLEGLVDQYLKLKADIKAGIKGPEKKAEVNQAGKVTSPEPSTGTGIKLSPGAENPIGTTLSKRIADLDPTSSKIDYRLDPEGKAKLNAMNENSLAQSLIESFGYQKKTDLNQIINSFDYGRKRPYSNKFRNTVLHEVEKAKDNLKSPDSSGNSIMSDEEVAAYLKQRYGNRDDVKGLGGDKRTWQQKNIIAKFASGDWENITKEDEIIPGGLYTVEDLLWDLGISVALVAGGTLAAPLFGTAAGAAAGGAVVAGGLIIRVIMRIALAIARWFMAHGNYLWTKTGLASAAAKKKASELAKTYRDGFYKTVQTNFVKWAFPVQVFITVVFKGLGDFIEINFPELYARIKTATAWVGTNVLAPAADTLDDVTGYRQKLGLKESLA